MTINEPKFKRGDEVTANIFTAQFDGIIETAIYDYYDKCWIYKLVNMPNVICKERYLTSKTFSIKIFIYSYLTKKNKIKTYLYTQEDNKTEMDNKTRELSKKYKYIGSEVFVKEFTRNLLKE